jgi:hypothetical protein
MRRTRIDIRRGSLSGRSRGNRKDRDKALEITSGLFLLPNESGRAREDKHLAEHRTLYVLVGRFRMSEELRRF